MLFGLWRTERFRISGFSEIVSGRAEGERETDGDGSGTVSGKGEVGGLSGVLELVDSGAIASTKGTDPRVFRNVIVSWGGSARVVVRGGRVWRILRGGCEELDRSCNPVVNRQDVLFFRKEYVSVKSAEVGSRSSNEWIFRRFRGAGKLTAVP